MFLRKLKDLYGYKVKSKKVPKYLKNVNKGEVFSQILYTNHYDTFINLEHIFSNIIISFIVSVNDETKDVTLKDLFEFLSINQNIKTIQKYNTETQTFCILVSGNVYDFSCIIKDSYTIYELENNIFINELRNIITFLPSIGFDDNDLSIIGMDRNSFSYANNFSIDKSKISDYGTSVKRLYDSDDCSENDFIILEMDHLESIITNEDIGISEFFNLQDIMELSYTILLVNYPDILLSYNKPIITSHAYNDSRFAQVLKIKTKDLIEILNFNDIALLNMIKDHISNNIYYNFRELNCFKDRSKLFHININEDNDVYFDPYEQVDEIL